jgi:hypothetical protein
VLGVDRFSMSEQHTLEQLESRFDKALAELDLLDARILSVFEEFKPTTSTIQQPTNPNHSLNAAKAA